MRPDSFPPKVDEFAPHTQRVNLRIVRKQNLLANLFVPTQPACQLLKNSRANPFPSELGRTPGNPVVWIGKLYTALLINQRRGLLNRKNIRLQGPPNLEIHVSDLFRVDSRNSCWRISSFPHNQHENFTRANPFSSELGRTPGNPCSRSPWGRLSPTPPPATPASAGPQTCFRRSFISSPLWTP